MLAGLLLAAAAAVTPVPTSDVRCAAVSFIMLKSKDPAIQVAARNAAFYWFGRIDRNQSDSDLAATLKAGTDGMTSTIFQAEAQRCDTEMRAHMEALHRWSAAVSSDAGQKDAK